MAPTLAHRGICVSDLDRAREFYAHALRFAPVSNGADDAEVMRQLTRRKDAQLRCQVMRDEAGVTLELIQYLRPSSSGTRERRPLNRFGLTHLCFWTPHIEDTAKSIGEWGGAPHWHTLISFEKMNARVMYCTDPDGVRIELGERREQPFAFLHSALCAADVAATVNFYGRFLGFHLIEHLDLQRHAQWLGPLMELPEVRLTAYVLANHQRDRIELLECHQPRSFGSRRFTTPNSFGLSHLTFIASDPDNMSKLIEQTDSARVLHSGDTELGGRTMACTDPNGITLIFVQDGPQRTPAITPQSIT
jgi:catechol 2,3-dioxygenase-like lactoylglutathione lyase family enzyme